VRELHLHGDNTHHLYKSSYEPIHKNLSKKKEKGTYDHEKAKKLWKYHADRVAKDYHKEHGGPMASPATRRHAASQWADEWHNEHEIQSKNKKEERTLMSFKDYIEEVIGSAHSSRVLGKDFGKKDHKQHATSVSRAFFKKSTHKPAN
jgi:hypothetical protein